MSIFFSLSLFYLSFIPLWISVLFVDIKYIIDGNNSLHTAFISIWCILLFIILSLVVVIKYIRKIKTREGIYEYTIVDAKENKSIITDYMLSYILPLFVFDFTHLDGVIMFLIFFITLGFFCIKHNNFCVNIIFEIANYRFYSCTLKNEDNVEIKRTIISRSRLNSNVGNAIHLKLLNNEFCIDVK